MTQKERPAKSDTPSAMVALTGTASSRITGLKSPGLTCCNPSLLCAVGGALAAIHPDLRNVPCARRVPSQNGKGKRKSKNREKKQRCTPSGRSRALNRFEVAAKASSLRFRLRASAAMGARS